MTDWNGSKQTGAVFLTGGLMLGHLLRLQAMLDEGGDWDHEQVIAVRDMNQETLDLVNRVLFEDDEPKGTGA